MRAVGLMDKASASGAGGSRFKSWVALPAGKATQDSRGWEGLGGGKIFFLDEASSRSAIV